VTKLPRGLSGKEVVKALERAGFYIKRQKGSHIVLEGIIPLFRWWCQTIRALIWEHYQQFWMEQG